MAKWFWLAAMLITAIPVGAAARQQSGEQPASSAGDEPDYTLTFTDVSASPEGDAALPVIFTRRSGVATVSEVRVRLTYPNSNLKYKSFELTDAAGGAGLDGKAQEGKPAGDAATLEMTFRLRGPAPRDFPSGPLATARFRFDDPAPGTSVTLQAELWIDGKPATPETARARVDDAHIEVAPLRIFMNCFFFTH